MVAFENYPDDGVNDENNFKIIYGSKFIAGSH
jgi:hypothetical protein